MITWGHRWCNFIRDAQVVGWFGALKLRFIERQCRDAATPSGKKPLYSLRIKEPRLTALLRGGSSDLYCFQQVFVSRDYACVDFLNSPRLIIDCGANAGFASMWFLGRFPGVHVIAIEPEIDNYTLCAMNLALFSNRITLKNVAVWSHPTRLVVRRGDYRDGLEWSTRVEPARSGEIGDIDAIDMPTLFGAASVIDLLKIDIEGGERTIFSENVDWLDRVSNLIVEIHDAECDQIVTRALQAYDYVRSEQNDMTIFRHLKRRPSTL
jgi:FkbM family methyltransferase